MIHLNIAEICMVTAVLTLSLLSEVMSSCDRRLIGLDVLYLYIEDTPGIKGSQKKLKARSPQLSEDLLMIIYVNRNCFFLSSGFC